MKRAILVGMALVALVGTADAQVRKDTFKAPNGAKLERTTDSFTGRTTYMPKERMWFDGYVSFDVRMATVRVLGRSEADPKVIKLMVQVAERGSTTNLVSLQFRGGAEVPFRPFVDVPDARCYNGFCFFGTGSIIEVPEAVLRSHAVGGEVEAQVAVSSGRPFRGKLDLREIDALDALNG
jgi:hypothetical protein